MARIIATILLLLAAGPGHARTPDPSAVIPNLSCLPGYDPCGTTNCCPPGQCNHDGSCATSCPPGFPVDCGTGLCCPAGNSCNPLNPNICCPAAFPVACQHTCCPAGGQCSPDGFSCGAACPPGFPVDCGTGLCCPASTTCNSVNPNICCPAGFPLSCQHTCCAAGSQCSPDGASCGAVCPPGFPVDCGTGLCCAAGNSCNTLNPQICCLPGFPVSCQHTCCPADHHCSADGATCVSSQLVCSMPGFPVDCGNGFCCPGGTDRCEAISVSGVVSTYCCIDVEEPVCCAASLAKTLGSVALTSTSSRSRCRGKPVKVRPFDMLQVSAGASGAPASFDIANHQYGVAFVGKGRGGTTVRVPVVEDDSDSTVLSAMVPPFLLGKKGKADVFLVVDGVLSDTCVSRVRIPKLPKSASRVPGLVTQSWLRANRSLYAAARPELASAEAQPFVDPEILTNVDTAIARVGELIPSFDTSGGARASKKALRQQGLTMTAKQSDMLLTGVLTAGQNVAHPAFASASQTWLQAMAAAKDGNDASLMAAEAAYTDAFMHASGASAQNVAKFANAIGGVTTAGVGASAVTFGGGVPAARAVAEAQAAAYVLCSSTVTTTAVVTGVRAVVTGRVTPGAGVTAYGKTLLQGSARVAAATRSIYGGVNFAASKLCVCRQPAITRVIDISVIIITIPGHIRTAAPRACLPDVPPVHSPVTTTTSTTMPPVAHCDDQQVAGGDTADTRLIELGTRSGSFMFDYETFSQQDRIIVSYEGRTLFDTGCVGANGTQVLNFAGTSTQVRVEVMPNCQGGTGTAWNYTVHCPS